MCGSERFFHLASHFRRRLDIHSPPCWEVLRQLRTVIPMSEPLRAEAPCSIDMDVETKWAASPKNPRNWSFGRKWVMAGVVSCLSVSSQFIL